VSATSSFDDLLNRADIHAFVIATPAASHFELARKALLAGKDVFVEKPIALHLEEGQELVQLARQHEKILMVGHLLVYHPAVRELKALIRSGDLGKIQYIYSSRLNWGKLRTEENILWSFAPHDISAILFLLDEEPTVVGAHGGSFLNHHIADITLSTFEFESGVKAHIFVSWLHPFKEQKLVVVGGRKLAVFDDTEKEHKLVLYPHRIDWVDRLPVARKAEGYVVPVDGDEPLRLECEHFLECVRERRRPWTDGESAIRVLRILEACEKSSSESLDLVAPGTRTTAVQPRHAGLPASVRHLAPTTSPPKFFVHPTAVVDEPCEVGEGTKIWHFSHVMAGSKIGRNCNLGQNVHIASDVRLGDNVKLQNNISVYTGVELEDDVFCGPSMVFTNVINPRSHVNRKHEYQRTLVRRGATLGANSTVVCGVTIGEYAFVGAGAVVTRDVPDHALVMGVPARHAGWRCQCGVRLALSGAHGNCPVCGESYVLEKGRLRRQPPVQAASA
jgi:UDP-2-acetamido-3-amino-2,3-dideoxy-glucuronate N-acetyltransferase